MKILVTGGAGFIASHITDAYINDGHKVVVIDNLSSGKRENVNPKATFYQADLNNYWEIEEIFLAEKPDLVNHHAGQISVNTSVENPIYDATVNVLGTINLLEASARYGIKKIILASSGGAIYDERYIPANEKSLLRPKSPYGIAQLSAERYLGYYRDIRKLKSAVLRYSNVYGPRQKPKGENGVIPIFVSKLLAKQAPVIFGDGKQTRDFIHVADVVRANLLASYSDFTGTLNISSGKETSINELLGMMQAETGTSDIREYRPAKPGEQQRSCLDNTAAKTAIGWEPKTSLQEGLRQLLRVRNEKSSQQISNNESSPKNTLRDI